MLPPSPQVTIVLLLFTAADVEWVWESVKDLDLSPFDFVSGGTWGYLDIGPRRGGVILQRRLGLNEMGDEDGGGCFGTFDSTARPGGERVGMSLSVSITGQLPHFNLRSEPSFFRLRSCKRGTVTSHLVQCH